MELDPLANAHPIAALRTFLSYASQREDEARTVYRFLKSVGLDCWWDKESLVGGQDWDRERRIAQNESDLFILIFSEEILTRDGVIQREIQEALEAAKDRRPDQIHIVPLRTASITLPSELSRYQWIDLFEADWRLRLARALEVALRSRKIPITASLEVALVSSQPGQSFRETVTEADERGSRSLEFVRYNDSGSYWDYVNAEILSYAIGRLYVSRREMADWHRQEGGSTWELRVSEFHREGQLVSLLVENYYFFVGTARSTRMRMTMNIFGSQCGKIQVGDLFNRDLAALNYLKDYCELDLKRQSLSEDHARSLTPYYHHLHEWKQWDFFENFNVNEKGMIINFSAASGLPNALGIFVVYIPWDVLATFLSPSISRFLKTCAVPALERMESS